MSFSQKAAFRNQDWTVAAILLLSLLLRWALVLRGGQYYISDEQRYETSRQVATFVFQGKLQEAFARLFIAPEHLGFKIIATLPALVEKWTQPSLAIPALFFSLFSVLNLYLIFRLAQRMGAGRREALLALGIAAASQSLLYYARHIMPYDTAMTFGLLSLYIALKRDATIQTALLCGALSFFCFLTYNGYWTLAGFAMLCHVFAGERKITTFLQRGLLLALGFVVPLILIVLAAKSAGINFLMEYTKFAKTINQGDFAEGWTLPFEYFWHAEHFLFVILVLLSIYAVVNGLRNREKSRLWWVFGIFFVYLCLLIFSVPLHKFVVYARLSRQMMPFLVLLSARGLDQIYLLKPSLRYVPGVVLLLIFLQGMWNYRTSYQLSYPREFSTEAQALYPDFKFSEKRMAFGAPPQCQHNGYVMENAKYFLTAPEAQPEIGGKVLLSHSHPVNFIPYQLEGYTPTQRREFDEQKLQMVFYKLDPEFMSENNLVWAEMKDCFVGE